MENKTNMELSERIDSLKALEESIKIWTTDYRVSPMIKHAVDGFIREIASTEVSLFADVDELYTNTKECEINILQIMRIITTNGFQVPSEVQEQFKDIFSSCTDEEKIYISEDERKWLLNCIDNKLGRTISLQESFQKKEMTIEELLEKERIGSLPKTIPNESPTSRIPKFKTQNMEHFFYNKANDNESPISKVPSLSPQNTHHAKNNKQERDLKNNLTSDDKKKSP